MTSKSNPLNFTSLEEVGAELLFEKCLTNSDMSGQGRLVVPKAQAHLLPSFTDTDCVNIPCQDGKGNKHTLRWRFWINQASRMYILESLQRFYEAYRLRPGNVIVMGLLPDGNYIICPKHVAQPCKGRRTHRVPGYVVSVEVEVCIDYLTDPGLGAGREDESSKAHRTGRWSSHSMACPDAAEHHKVQRQEAHAGIVPGPDHGGKQMAQRWWQTSNGVMATRPIHIGSLPKDCDTDHIFRAVPQGFAEDLSQEVWIPGGCWMVALSVGTELYQAFFEDERAAEDTLFALGADFFWQDASQGLDA